jgi:glycosyltransferase involved in cell wall biosynthesis
VEHGWDANRFRELPHFQRPHHIEPVPSSDAPLFYCGRLSPEKGVDDLLRAMQRLPDLHLLIAGDGPQRRDLQRLADDLNLSNVEFIGAVNCDERDRLIRSARFTVLPSHAYETLGKTILESYAQGRAVIATDLGSRREFVHEGETGLLYQSGDIPQLARSIRTLADNPELADQMGRAGWDLVRQNHAPEEHYSKLFALYEDLVSGKRDLSGKPVSAIRTSPWKNIPTSSAIRPNLRVAFIGGRGLISKYSGIESYYEEVGSRLAEMGHEVTVYCRSHFTPALSEYNRMRIVRLPTLRSKHLETLIHTLLSTAHALTQKYDVVHYHALGPALFSWIPRLFGTATTVTVQGLDWQRAKWGKTASAVLQLGERASVLFPARTMVVSQTLQRHYRQAHSLETVFVPNGGVLPERIAPHKILEWGLELGRYVLFLGRFSPEKGCHVLIEAFERIETDVKLVLAGGASYCDAYAQDVLSHASDRIRILSWVSGPVLDELLTNAMLFVLPSEMEGLSLALLDAMGAGICVLASDIAENHEAVEGAGFTFRCGSVADLADRLRFLIANPDIREVAGKAARKRVEEHYNWNKLAKDVERVYFDVLGLQAPESAQRKSNQPIFVAEPESMERLVG